MKTLELEKIMYSNGYMKKYLGTLTQPWRRERKKPPYYRENCDPKLHKFNLFVQNQNLDILTKRASLQASKFVVFIESYYGEKMIFQCTGFIMESDNNCSIVLTTARILSTDKNIKTNRIKVIVHLPDARSFDGQIVVYNLHLNVAAIKIQPNTPLPAASLTRLRDYITVDPSHHVKEEELFQRHPNSSGFDLIPGDVVIAVGRFFRKPHSIMAAPGVFSIERSFYDCKDLLMASCRITSCGIGCPLINRFAEVIGICLHDDVSTAFLPINIASIWWEHYKINRQNRQLLMGMEVANLYAAPLRILEKIMEKFPDVVKGVIVEEVVPGSSAEAAGIKYNDVIIQIDGKEIQSVLELYETMWAKVGKSLELLVVRTSDDVILPLNMVLYEA